MLCACFIHSMFSRFTLNPVRFIFIKINRKKISKADRHKCLWLTHKNVHVLSSLSIVIHNNAMKKVTVMLRNTNVIFGKFWARFQQKLQRTNFSSFELSTTRNVEAEIGGSHCATTNYHNYCWTVFFACSSLWDARKLKKWTTGFLTKIYYSQAKEKVSCILNHGN